MTPLSLFVGLSCVVLSLACHPECACSDDSVVPAVCAVYAKPINCSILCANVSHLSSCQPLHCWMRTPAEQCEVDSCPQVEIKCRPPICTARLADCQIQCQAIQAGWSCLPPGDTPIGCGELTCDESACVADLEDYTVLVNTFIASAAAMRTAVNMIVLVSLAALLQL